MRASDHVSFNGNYSTEHCPAMPAGKELTDLLETELKDKGIIILFRYQTDYSHGVELSVSGVKFYVELGTVGDESANWLAFICFKYNLFGLLPIVWPHKLALLANAINEALHTIPEITDIRWYKNQHTWNYNSSNYTVSP